MKRDETLIEQRRQHIKNRVDSVVNKPTEIKRLAKELFVTEQTIYRELKKN